MDKINFENLPSTNSPINAENLNQMQDNVENAIPVVIDNLESDSATDALSAKQGKVLSGKIDGIIESGSNANGNYIKYADGTMICTKKVTGKANITASWGSLYDTGENPLDLGDWAFPFSEFPRVSAQFIGANGQWIESFPTTPSKTSAGAITIVSATKKTANVYYDIIAIGKWK